jgi:cytochrome c2
MRIIVNCDASQLLSRPQVTRVANAIRPHRYTVGKSPEGVSMTCAPEIRRLARHRTGIGRRTRATAVAVMLCVTSACDRDAAENGALWGRDSPAAKCVVCHSLGKNGPFRVAPNLWGIVGDAKARDRDWYSYSPGLLALGGTWTRTELDRFLENPAALAPGTRMKLRVTDADERQRIIDFLAEQQ